MTLSLKEIAEIAGVSKTTVSMVVNGRGEHYRISAETREHVLRLVEEYGYSPNAQARSLRLRKTQTLGIVVPGLVNRFFAEFAERFDGAAREQGYQVFLTSTNDDLPTEIEVVKNLLSRNIDGLVIASADSAGRWTPSNKYLSIPRGYIDRLVARPEASWVVSDDYDGAYRLVDELCRRGAKEVYYIGGGPRISTSKDRLRGVRDALNTHQRTQHPDQILERGYDFRDGYAMAQQLHAQRTTPPEALFTGSMTLFEGVLQYLQEQAPQWLEQTRFATFGKQPMLDYLPGSIISAHQDVEKMVTTTLEFLLKQIAGDPAIQQIKIPLKFVFR